MLIVNADDYGLNRRSTDNILKCAEEGRVTSASAMLFMADSERAAKLALSNNLSTGLHINFTLLFDSLPASHRLNGYQQRISSFLLRSRYSSLFYNPLLKRAIEEVYTAQYNEYLRLYKKPPSHFDGHHHMHLCMNMLLGGYVPKGEKVRRNFSFIRSEKGLVNRTYRKITDAMLLKRQRSTDLFFSILPLSRADIERKIELAADKTVELEVHPENTDEYRYLLDNEFAGLIQRVRLGSYADL